MFVPKSMVGCEPFSGPGTVVQYPLTSPAGSDQAVGNNPGHGPRSSALISHLVALGLVAVASRLSS